MVSVNILFIKLRDSRVNTFCLWKSKAPSFSTSFPPLTQSLHQKCELLLLCTEHCIHTHTHTHTPAALGQWPKYPAPLPCRQLQYAEPGAVATTKQHRGCDHRAQGTWETTKMSYFEEILPKPVSRARQQVRQERAAWAGWKDMCMCALTHVWLWDSIAYSLPGSSVHGIPQARILEWDAISCSRRSSRPSDRTCVSWVSCIGRQILYHWRYLRSPWSKGSPFKFRISEKELLLL